MYVCVWVPGGVVVRPWAHNHKGEFKPGTCPSGDVVQLYSFSITMWCEKSIQHQPTSSPRQLQMGTWNSGVQIHWPFLIHQPGSGGTSGAHTSGWER